MEVEMKIRGLMMDPVSNMPIVLLKDVGSDTVLPIWVGVYEANAIALEIEKVNTPRPMTHDLIKNVLTGLDALVHKVVVTELKDDTFYAVIWLEREGHVVSMPIPCPRLPAMNFASGWRISAMMTWASTRCKETALSRQPSVISSQFRSAMFFQDAGAR